MDNNEENLLLYILNICKGFLLSIAGLFMIVVYAPKACYNIYKWTVKLIKNGINKGGVKQTPPK